MISVSKGFIYISYEDCFQEVLLRELPRTLLLQWLRLKQILLVRLSVSHDTTVVPRTVVWESSGGGWPMCGFLLHRYVALWPWENCTLLVPSFLHVSKLESSVSL